MTDMPVRLLATAAAFVLLTNSAVAEELRSVDPNRNRRRYVLRVHSRIRYRRAGARQPGKV
jgi:hypothetical protein